MTIVCNLCGATIKTKRIDIGWKNIQCKCGRWYRLENGKVISEEYMRSNDILPSKKYGVKHD